MNKRPQDTSAEEPDGGNPHIRFRGGPGQGDRPGLLNNKAQHFWCLAVKGVLCCLLAEGSMTAIAQQDAPATQAEPAADSGGLAEIVVTAQKRSQSLSTVPISVNVVDSVALDTHQVNSVSDLVDIVPSFEFARAPNSIPSITFRGVGPEAGNTAFDASIGMYVDGVFLGNVLLYNQTLFDVDRIEMIYGTQSTLQGLNATIGALSVVNKRPDNSFGGNVELGGELQNGGYFADGAVNMPVSDVLSLRFSGRYFFDNGYIKNTATGLWGPADTDGGIRAQALFDAHQGFTALFSYQHTDNTIHGSATQIAVAGPIECLGKGPCPGPANFGSTTLSQFSSSPALDHGDTYLRSTSDVPILTLTYDLGSATLTSISSALWSNNSDNFDFDFSTKNDSLQLLESSYHQATQEFRIASNEADKFFSYLAGFFYYHAAYHVSLGEYFGIPDFPPGSPLQGQLFNGPFITTLEQRTDAESPFGQVSIKPTDAFTVAVGLRYTHQDKDDWMGRASLPPYTLWNTVIQAPFPYQKLTPVSDNLVSGSVSAQYQFTRDLMTYVSASHGGKSGGYGEFNTIPFDGTFYSGIPGGNPDKDARVGAERSYSYEAGVKSAWLERRITANIAAFAMYINGLQQLGFQSSGTFISVNQYVRDVGFDGSFAYRVTPEIKLGLSATYADAQDTHLHQQIGQSPRWSGVANADWTHAINGRLQFNIGTTERFRSSKYNQLYEQQPTGSFATLGLHAGIASAKGWHVQVDSENVTNAKGADFGFPGPDPFVAEFETLAPLRTIFVSVGTTF